MINTDEYTVSALNKDRWNNNHTLLQNELAELGEAENRSRMEKFLKTETAVASASQAAQAGQCLSLTELRLKL